MLPPKRGLLAELAPLPLVTITREPLPKNVLNENGTLLAVSVQHHEAVVMRVTRLLEETQRQHHA